MTPTEANTARRDLSRRWSSFPEPARPHVSNLMQMLKHLPGYVRPEWATYESQTLQYDMAKSLERIERASR